MGEVVVDNKKTDKKYYWIKLKKDFFNLAEIDFLLSQKNGCKYIVLYQMLCLQTVNNNGLLASKIGELIVPFDPEKIARETKYFDVETIVVAMDLFKKLNLIYIQEDGCLSISNFENMVGSESKWAKIKREQREKAFLEQNDIKLLDNVQHEIGQSSGQCVGQILDNVQQKIGQCPKNNWTMSKKTVDNVQQEIEIRDIDNNIYINNNNNINNNIMTLDTLYIYINKICARARENSTLKNELERLEFNFDISLLDKLEENNKTNVMLILYAINEIFERKI